MKMLFVIVFLFLEKFQVMNINKLNHFNLSELLD